ncbi:MAG: BolA/IbaG family iron-sulfur metabolism protein [Proteobacteria bacterium]|nr:BolA/IbaG family iron-sulfur metabolism protein [Pseudomonadota bacterium]
MTAAQIQQMIAQALPTATVVVEDPMNDNTHFRAVVVCPDFAGKSMVEQHRMVYAALGDAFSGPLHALQLRTSAK